MDERAGAPRLYTKPSFKRIAIVTSAEENPFWTFSLRVYGHEPVRKPALLLQDKHGADVNILLFLAWRRHAGAPPVTAGELTAMEAAAAPLRGGLIQPLRDLRQWLPEVCPGPTARAPLKDALLAAELAAEKAEQDILYRQFSQTFPAAQQGDLAADVRLYLNTLGAAGADALAADFATAVASVPA